jgi:hypothetical protein
MISKEAPVTSDTKICTKAESETGVLLTEQVNLRDLMRRKKQVTEDNGLVIL